MATEPKLVPVAIIGAGPQALTVALHLLSSIPSDHPSEPDTPAIVDSADDLVVIDEGGVWLGRWQQRFDDQGLERLRSVAMNHPGACAPITSTSNDNYNLTMLIKDPNQREALLEFAGRNGRESELTEVDENECFFSSSVKRYIQTTHASTNCPPSFC